MIRAPFNFVPRSKLVFFPNWAGRVCMDIPLQDAQTGKIHLRLTAQTPIFVRQGQMLSEAPSKEFFHREGVYYIPATSIKGMVRNILEIISFGKLGFDGDRDSSYWQHVSAAMDLPECIFGRVKGESVKGRVQFSQAELKSPLQKIDEQEAYCGQPKASYDPIYRDGNYLKGWKRYPVRSDISDIPDVTEGNEDFAQHFIPLASGSVFECDMRYFNLKREELGALIYAMNFFDGARYSIGFGKPYGFGQVTIELSGNDEMEELKREFINEISSRIENYAESEQLRELREMMTLHPEKEHLLEYMSLAEYNEHKEDGSVLPYYSQLESVIIEEHTEEPVHEVSSDLPIEQQPETETESKGLLAKVKSITGDSGIAVLMEGKDKKDKKLVFNSFNPNHKADMKKMKKNPGMLIRVTMSNDGSKLIYMGIDS